MIVSPGICDLIRTGRKTELRTLVETRDGYAHPCPYRKDRPITITIKGADESEPFQLRVLHVRTQLLADVNAADAQAEGWPTLNQFQAAWVRSRDAIWVATREQKPDAATLTARYQKRWAHHPVYAVYFDLVDARRILHGLPHEPEAVDHATQQRLTKAAHDRDLERKKGVDNDLLQQRATLGAQLDTYRAVANARGIDVSSDTRVIQKRLAAIEQKIRKQTEARNVA